MTKSLAHQLAEYACALRFADLSRETVHEVKRRVFGDARAGHVTLARQLTVALLTRIQAAEPMSASLLSLRGAIQAAKAASK